MKRLTKMKEMGVVEVDVDVDEERKAVVASGRRRGTEVQGAHRVFDARTIRPDY